MLSLVRTYIFESVWSVLFNAGRQTPSRILSEAIAQFSSWSCAALQFGPQGIGEQTTDARLNGRLAGYSEFEYSAVTLVTWSYWFLAMKMF
jgi:hypothetical protein